MGAGQVAGAVAPSWLAALPPYKLAEFLELQHGVAVIPVDSTFARPAIHFSVTRFEREKGWLRRVSASGCL